MPSMAPRVRRVLAAAARALARSRGEAAPRRRSLEERWNERLRDARARVRTRGRARPRLARLGAAARAIGGAVRRTTRAAAASLIALGRPLGDRRGTRRPVGAGEPPARCATCAALREAVRRAARGSRARLRALAGARRVLARLVPRASARDPGSRDAAKQSRVLRRRPYRGSRERRYELHLPRGYRGRGALPLVMLLHGCRQTSADIRAVSRLDALADRAQFVAVYPFVTGYADIRLENCWGWWREEDIRPGAGEVEDLAQIVAEVREEIAIDPRRIHVAGLSSGGAMAVAALVAHPTLFASGAAVAGLPYSETARAVGAANGGRPAFKDVVDIGSAMDEAMGEAKRETPLLVVHSRDDPVVDAQAARNLRDSWRRCFDLGDAASTRRGRTRGTPWVHERYRGRSRRTVVETLILEGPGHGWYGGAPGEFSYPDAPDVSRLMWTFFKTHPRERRARARAAPHEPVVIGEARRAGGRPHA